MMFCYLNSSAAICSAIYSDTKINWKGATAVQLSRQPLSFGIARLSVYHFVVCFFIIHKHLVRRKDGEKTNIIQFQTHTNPCKSRACGNVRTHEKMALILLMALPDT